MAEKRKEMKIESTMTESTTTIKWRIFMQTRSFRLHYITLRTSIVPKTRRRRRRSRHCCCCRCRTLTPKTISKVSYFVRHTPHIYF